MDEAKSEASVLEVAKALWRDHDDWREKIESFAVAKLLCLKNETWLEEDEPPISESEFIERMSLQSISVYPDGSFEFMHDDGDLFWGHAIQVTGNLHDGPTDADIPG